MSGLFSGGNQTFSEKSTAFYAEGRKVFHRPIEKKNPDGTSSMTMGFFVCEVSESLEPASVVELLNRGDSKS